MTIGGLLLKPQPRMMSACEMLASPDARFNQLPSFTFVGHVALGFLHVLFEGGLVLLESFSVARLSCRLFLRSGHWSAFRPDEVTRQDDTTEELISFTMLSGGGKQKRDLRAGVMLIDVPRGK